MEWTDQLRMASLPGQGFTNLEEAEEVQFGPTPDHTPDHASLAASLLQSCCSCVPVADLPSQPDVREEEVVHDASGARQLGQHVGGAHIELPDARVRLVREHVDGDGNLAEQHDGGEDKDEEEDAVGAIAHAEVSTRLAR